MKIISKFVFAASLLVLAGCYEHRAPNVQGQAASDGRKTDCGNPYALASDVSADPTNDESVGTAVLCQADIGQVCTDQGGTRIQQDYASIADGTPVLAFGESCAVGHSILDTSSVFQSVVKHAQSKAVKAFLKSRANPEITSDEFCKRADGAYYDVPFTLHGGLEIGKLGMCFFDDHSALDAKSLSEGPANPRTEHLVSLLTSPLPRPADE